MKIYHLFFQHSLQIDIYDMYFKTLVGEWFARTVIKSNLQVVRFDQLFKGGNYTCGALIRDALSDIPNNWFLNANHKFLD